MNRRANVRPAYGVAFYGVALLVGTTVLHLLWLTFHWGGEAYRLLLGNILYLLPTVAATFVVMSAALKQQGKVRRGWLLIGLGLAALAVGNSLWSYFELIAGSDPFPFLADLFYLLFGPLLAAGFFTLMPNVRNRLEGAKLGLELAITLGAVGLYFWRFLLAPTLRPLSQACSRRPVWERKASSSS